MPFDPKEKEKGFIFIAWEYGSVQPGALDFGRDLSAHASVFLI